MGATGPAKFEGRATMRRDLMCAGSSEILSSRSGLNGAHQAKGKDYQESRWKERLSMIE